MTDLATSSTFDPMTASDDECGDVAASVFIQGMEDGREDRRSKWLAIREEFRGCYRAGYELGQRRIGK